MMSSELILIGLRKCKSTETRRSRDPGIRMRDTFMILRENRINHWKFNVIHCISAIAFLRSRH